MPQDKIKKLYLVRHGHIHETGTYIGSSDVILSPKGREDVSNLCDYINHLSFDIILCSPLTRCKETCKILFPSHKPRIDNRLREIDFGSWEQMSYQEIVQKDPALFNKWAENPYSFTFPKGEAFQDFYSRIKDISSYIKSIENESLILVTHGGVIRHLLCDLLAIDFANYLSFQIQYAKISTIHVSKSGGTLIGLNLGPN